MLSLTAFALFAAAGLPVWAFLLAVLLVALLASELPRIYRNRAFYAVKLMRRTGWGWPLYLAPVSGAMPGTAIGITMNPGYAGQYSRNGDNITEAKLVTSGTYTGNINFGDAVVLIPDATGGTYAQAAAFIAAAGTFIMGTNGNVTSMFAGFAVREVKQQLTINTFGGATSANNTLGYYAAGNPCDVLVRGSIMAGNFFAKSGNAAPVAGGPVWLRVSTNGAGTFVGALETVSDTSHTVQITNAQWTTGVVDTTNGTIEVTLTTRNIP